MALIDTDQKEKSTNPRDNRPIPQPSEDVFPSLRGWPPITSTRIGIIALGLCSICGMLGAIAAVVTQRSVEAIAIIATLTGTAIGSLAGFLNSVWQR